MIIVVQNIPYLADALRVHDEVLSVPYTEIDNELLRKTGCTALFVRTTTKVYKDLLDQTQVRFVGTATSGVDHMDLEYLIEHGIYYASAAGSNANAVAEYAIYSLLRYIIKTGRSVAETNLGVIGYGHIGTLVAAYAHELGMRVVVNDPPLQREGRVLPRSYGDFVSLESVLRESHVISNHIPLVKEGEFPTASLINTETLRYMQDGTHLIHSSRGGIVDEDALLDALKHKRMSASIDVWSGEPRYNLELARTADVATPHVSGHSDDGIIVAAERLLHEYSDFSGNEYEAEIITKHKSEGRRTVNDFNDIQELANALSKTLRIDELSTQLRNPPEEHDAELRRYFMQLRMAYRGRPEILTL